MGGTAPAPGEEEEKKPIVNSNESFKAKYLKYKKKYLYTKQKLQQQQNAKTEKK